MSMYFGVSWLDPRLRINDSATEWTEVKTGPKDVRTTLQSVTNAKLSQQRFWYYQEARLDLVTTHPTNYLL